MPIYIYRCENCGVQFERHQSFTDEPLKRCPECSKNTLRKVLTPAGIVFKGSGWYATDHKSTSGLNRPARNEGKDASSSGESSPKTGSGENTSTSATSEASTSKNESSSSKTESSTKSGE